MNCCVRTYLWIHFQQYSSYSAYGLSQPPQAPAAAAIAAPAQTAYTQASLFLQTAPAAAAQSDLYGSTSQYRSQYGSTQQPNTIMVSSTSTSSAVKPPSAPSHFNEFSEYTRLLFSTLN